MLTKERILELLGDAPEKMYRWEQEVILLEKTQNTIKSICLYLHRNKIPFRPQSKKTILPPEINIKIKNIKISDRNKIIETAKHYKISPTTLLNHIEKGFNTTRKIPNKVIVLEYYNNWVKNHNGNTVGWKKSFCKEYNISTAAFLKFREKNNITFPNTNIVTKEQMLYLKQVIKNLYNEEVFSKVSNIWDYILTEYNSKFPERKRSTVRTYVIKLFGNDVYSNIKKLQYDFLQNLLDTRDKSIPKQTIAKIWHEKYPMLSMDAYRRYLIVGNVKEYKKRVDCWKRKPFCAENVEIFIDNLPNSLTKEQLNQIVEAYEKAVY